MRALAPSLAGMRMMCPGSHRMLDHAPEHPPDERALHGIAVHALAAAMLSTLDDHYAYTMPSKLEGIATITDDMANAAIYYVDVVINYLRNDYLKPINLRVEDKVTVPQISNLCRGTVDAWMYNPVTNKIHIIDLKTGYTSVQAVENWQLIEYALGVIYTLTQSGINIYPTTELNLIIVQPNDFAHVAPKHWTLTVDTLTNVYYPKLIRNELLALQDNAPCVTSHMCKYCPARAICPALQEAALASMDYARGATPHPLSNDALSVELRALKSAERLIQARITGLEEEAFARLKSGDKIQKIGLKPKTSAKHWIAPIDQVITAGDLCGIDLRKPVDVITPTQAERKGMPKEYVSLIADRTDGGLKLVYSD